MTSLGGIGGLWRFVEVINEETNRVNLVSSCKCYPFKNLKCFLLEVFYP